MNVVLTDKGAFKHKTVENENKVGMLSVGCLFVTNDMNRKSSIDVYLVTKVCCYLLLVSDN